jgi:DNA-binding Xre family transcriptional regulator
MSWTESDRRDRAPDEQRGWEILGAMVLRRRTLLGWSQRELGRGALLAQSTISRLENGKLKGMRMGQFARLVAAMGGLDPALPAPPRPGRWGWW